MNSNQTIRSFSYIIEDSEYVPTLAIKTLKEQGKFLYSVTLSAMIKGESKQIARIDNYHDGKTHHIHHIRNEEEKQLPISVKNFKEASQYFIDNWSRMVIEYMKWIEGKRA